MANTADWQGRVGREWADKADALDRLLGPIGDAGIEALGNVSGRTLLDLGCGAGATSLALARRGALVTGLDISEDLLAKARSRDPARTVTFTRADATTFTPVAAFDLLHSRCGAMFFDDEIAAWTHLRTILRPGAPIALTTWRTAQEHDWAALPLHLASPILGAEATRIAAPLGPGPFAWSDPGHFLPILHAAGWRDIHHTPITAQARMEAGPAPTPAERAADFALRIGPLASRLRGTDPATRARIRAALAEGLAPHVTGTHVTVTTAAWLIRAHG